MTREQFSFSPARTVRNHQTESRIQAGFLDSKRIRILNTIDYRYAVNETINRITDGQTARQPRKLDPDKGIIDWLGDLLCHG